MSKLIIEGPSKLEGVIKVAGSKNHVLPMLASILLTTQEVVLHNVPDIADARVMIEILEQYGVRVERNRNSVVCNAKDAHPAAIPVEITSKLRASILVLGSALSRFGEVELGFPGGDAIGARPIDAHLLGLEAMGAKNLSDSDNIKLSGKLKGTRVLVHEISVTATETLILAAILSQGTTEIRMAAAEPHITGLCEFLNNIGAKISGVGSHVLTIEGVHELTGGEGTIVPDYLESGTFAIAAAASAGDLMIDDFIVNDHDALLNAFNQMGVNYKVLSPSQLQVMPTKRIKSTRIRTNIFPGFPSDLQAPMAVLLTQAEGRSEIFETIYEDRLQYLFELQRMGAHVNIRDSHVGLVEVRLTCMEQIWFRSIYVLARQF